MRSIETTFDELRIWQRFHVRLTAIYGGTVLITLLCMGAIAYYVAVNAEVDNLRQRLKMVAATLAAGIDGDAVARLDLTAAELSPIQANLQQRFAALAAADPDISSIYVFRPAEELTKLRFVVDYVREGRSGTPGELYAAADLPVLIQGFDRPVAEERPYRDEFGLSLSGYAPLRNAEGRTVAVVGVDVQARRLTEIRNRVWTATGALFGVGLILVAAASWLVARSIRYPLGLMIAATSAIAAGQLDTRVGLTRRDEFGLLGARLDTMAGELRDRQFIRDTFGRYVSEDVARALLASGREIRLGGEERVVTILFADLRNYTTISEALSPTQMVTMLNTYFGAMNEVIDQHRGCVIEFLGDAVLAVFGAPHSQADHANNAVACAVAMREQLALLNSQWQDAGIASLWQHAGVPSIELRVGLHTGAVVAGNLGSRTRTKYAVIGDSVNVASRLEGLNKDLGTTILLSADTLAHLAPEWRERVHDKGEFAVKGRHQVVRVYAI